MKAAILGPKRVVSSNLPADCNRCNLVDNLWTPDAQPVINIKLKYVARDCNDRSDLCGVKVLMVMLFRSTLSKDLLSGNFSHNKRIAFSGCPKVSVEFLTIALNQLSGGFLKLHVFPVQLPNHL